MKLNQDCVRNLLLTIEEELSINEPLDAVRLQQKPRLQQYSLDDIVYTISKLKEAGFINADVLVTLDGTDAIVSSLTYNGHLFLDNIRDDGVWKLTKQAASKLSSVSLNILAELASSYIKNKLNL
ncbi:DUF2513 domain-containing protein [Parageobacillus thermoglucosidasius]|uniref:DUF2513 domain-containing protein n=1 Tax=Parageobacillus thermoglucosidasius TaxID=1426 RepID=UPI000E12D507|nr:DUF2513 domain-containing protein [Parageobacillus thermoglucosidasius]REK59004.1 MAG: hypothetical protein C6P36_02905 [Geobacillus sp.]MED4904087.1 DUF2513 domain-containing protein [Parageobacillus thermoglucosidasius]MED4915637.1 DUF2513 domain-containing protein [Parageobacillus thermoglucosidasius]MED4945098.1 DUF2513 domain-containing protein [Parageobacillus thermoglucosidasius]MED4983705.1 DUF2513 domain-containing protein [Parageobacillus thermoglucosidasius]